MKKCIDCNVEMIDDCKLEGEQRFRVGSMDDISDISILIPGLHRTKLRARVCPNCGKVEFYVDQEVFD